MSGKTFDTALLMLRHKNTNVEERNRLGKIPSEGQTRKIHKNLGIQYQNNASPYENKGSRSKC